MSIGVNNLVRWLLNNYKYVLRLNVQKLFEIRLFWFNEERLNLWTV